MFDIRKDDPTYGHGSIKGKHSQCMESSQGTCKPSKKKETKILRTTY